MHSNEITWVILLNSTTCRIFNYKKHKQLELVNEFSHPENKLRDIDLTSDKPGHYKASNSTHGSYSQQTDPKEIKIDNFTREIANKLDHGRNNHLYNKLIIIAAPHVYGLLLKHTNQHVKNFIIQNIDKDLIHQTNQELLDYLSQF